MLSLPGRLILGPGESSAPRHGTAPDQGSLNVCDTTQRTPQIRLMCRTGFSGVEDMFSKLRCPIDVLQSAHLYIRKVTV